MDDFYKDSAIRGLSTASLISTLERAGVGLWVWNASTDDVDFSEKIYETFDLDRSDSPNLQAIEGKIIKEDRESFRSALEKTKTDGTQNEIQYRIQLEDGSLRWISSLSGARFSELDELIDVWGMTRDVSRERREHQEPRKRNAQFRSIYESIPFPVVFSDIDQRIQLVNQALIETFGYENEELEGKATETLYADPKALPDIGNEGLSTASRIHKYTHRTACKRKNHEVFRGETVVSPVIDETGEPIGFIHVIRDVEKRSKQEELLLRQTRLLKRSEELANVGHWNINLESGKLTWSDEVYRIHGLDKKTYQPTVESAINAYHSDDREEVQRCVDESIETGEPFSFVLRIIRPDGSIRNVESMGECEVDKHGVTTSVFGIFHDVTEHKRIESELQNEEKRYRNLFDQSADGILIISKEGRILEANLSLCSVFGYSSEELEGREVYLLHPESEREKMADSISGFDVERPSDIELICLKKSGDTFLARITPSVIEVDGKVFIQALFRDITEEKRAESELRRAKEQAEESDRLKSAFLSNMSHEIRTPLNCILGFSQLLKMNDFPQEEMESHIDTIFNNGSHLLRLIEDIIDIAQIESGQLNVCPSEFDLNDLMLETYSFFQNEVELRHHGDVTLILDNALTESKRVISDGTRIRQVLYNLLGNANKFTEMGVINYGYKERSNHVFEFYVQDTGVGLNAECLETIFERFQQADDSLTRMHEGAGLGLTISKGLVELLGGSITVDSKPGKGSDFRFTIRFEVPEEPKKPRATASPADSLITSLPPAKVLIAEDEQVNFDLLEGILKESRLELIHAKNGIEALEIAYRDTDIDLVLMDIQMPQMNGYETSRRLKQLRPNLPIIAQSAFAMPEDRFNAADSGCDAFLPKPIVIDDLARVLSRHLAVI